MLDLIEAHPERKLILPIHDGRTADLQDTDLSNIDLRGAYLLKVDLQDSDLRSADLHGAFLAYANLQGVALENADLQDANLMHATLQEANCKNANMNGADLRHANLHKAYLEGANLKNARLLEATMQNSNLHGADLEDADLSATKLHDAYLNRAKLMRAHLNEANLQRTKFGGAVLKDAHLYAADLREADLVLADLTNANLNSANLQGANLHLTDLRAADLTEAKLQGVDLSVASNISNIYLCGAWLDRTRISLEKLGDSIGEESNGDYTAAKSGYLALKQNFDDIGDYEASSWAYCRERRMEKLEAREIGRAALEKRERRLPKLSTDDPMPMERDLKGTWAGYSKYVSDTLVEWLCDYGESPRRVILWMAILLFVVEPFSLSFLGGFGWDPYLADRYYILSSTWNKFWFSYWLHILYSFGGIGASNFSGLQPANIAVNLASSLFSIIEIFLVGLLGFVAGNRIRRS